jgi:hypothetical protein
LERSTMVRDLSTSFMSPLLKNSSNGCPPATSSSLRRAHTRASRVTIYYLLINL